jgi:hypothetical protein
MSSRPLFNKFWHRWARLLKQKSSITVYSLPTKENKLPFSVSSKQTEVCHFRFQQTNGCLPFLFPSTNGSPFLFFICSKLTEVALYCEFRFPFAKFWKHGDGRHGGIYRGLYLDPKTIFIPPPLLKMIFFPLP